MRFADGRKGVPLANALAQVIAAQQALADETSSYNTQVTQLETQIAQQEDALSILLGRNPGDIIRGRALPDLPLDGLRARRGEPRERVRPGDGGHERDLRGRHSHADALERRADSRRSVALSE